MTLTFESGIWLKENKSLWPWVTGLLVDVHLKVLVLPHEAPPGGVYGLVVRVCLGHQCWVVTVVKRGLDLNDLAWDQLADSVGVTPLALAAAFPQPRLDLSRVRYSIRKSSFISKLIVIHLWQFSGQFLGVRRQVNWTYGLHSSPIYNECQTQ